MVRKESGLLFSLFCDQIYVLRSATLEGCLILKGKLERSDATNLYGDINLS